MPLVFVDLVWKVKSALWPWFRLWTSADSDFRKMLLVLENYWFKSILPIQFQTFPFDFRCCWWYICSTEVNLWTSRRCRSRNRLCFPCGQCYFRIIDSYGVWRYTEDTVQFVCLLRFWVTVQYKESKSSQC